MTNNQLHEALKRMVLKIVQQTYQACFIGVVVGSLSILFRWLIEYSFSKIRIFYSLSHVNMTNLLLIVLLYFLISFLYAVFVPSDTAVSGSGAEWIDAALKEQSSENAWKLLWRKFSFGVLAISSGLMLGRAGPSLHLGAIVGKLLSQNFNLDRKNQKLWLIAGTAAALSATFQVPLASFLLACKRDWQLTKQNWLFILLTSFTANLLSGIIFGFKPILNLENPIPNLPFSQYWLILILGVGAGVLAYFYKKTSMKVGILYQWLDSHFFIQPAYNSLIAFAFILPIGFIFPELLGGGNHLILLLESSSYSFWILCAFFMIRFIASIISYESGLPGGIFLPNLVLGALLGILFAKFFSTIGLIDVNQIYAYMILGMGGYFASVLKSPTVASVLVIEVVGTDSNLLSLGLVTIISWVTLNELEKKL